MSKTILQINYKFSSSRAGHTELVSPLAEPIAGVDGLIWKIWLMNEKEREAGGIYVFEDEKSLGAFLSGKLAAKVTSHPAISDMTVKQFENMDEITAITRGPIDITTHHTS